MSVYIHINKNFFKIRKINNYDKKRFIFIK